MAIDRRRLLKSAAIAGAVMAAQPHSRAFAYATDDEFPLTDLHVHLTPSFDRSRDGDREEDGRTVRHYGQSRSRGSR